MQEKCWGLFTFQWNGGALLALGIHSVGPVHLCSDSSYFGETKWLRDRRGGNRLGSATDTQKAQECWLALYPASSTASQHELLASATPALGMQLYLPELSSEKLPLHWFLFLLNMVDLLNIVLYGSHLYLLLNWQSWGISFLLVLDLLFSWPLPQQIMTIRSVNRQLQVPKNPQKNPAKKTPLKITTGQLFGVLRRDHSWKCYLTLGQHLSEVFVWLPLAWDPRNSVLISAHPMAPVHRVGSRAFRKPPIAIVILSGI